MHYVSQKRRWLLRRVSVFLCTVVTGLYALLLQLYMHCWSTVFCVHVVISNFFSRVSLFSPLLCLGLLWICLRSQANPHILCTISNAFLFLL